MKIRFLRWLVIILPAAVVLVMIGVWMPRLRQLAFSTPHRDEATMSDHDEHGHAEEADHAAAQHDEHCDGHDEGDEHEAEHDEHEADHDDHEHDEAAAIKLSRQAQGNIGLRMTQVALRSFERTITVPGIVVERPGWSVLDVTAPMTGVVTRVYPLQGEAVEPGQPLFDIRLTHEDLLQSQTEYLRTLEELDVIGREVARLDKVYANGVIAGKTLLERKYEQQKQQARLRVQRQALLLHGLSEDQVDGIATHRTLVHHVTIRAPSPKSRESKSHPLQVQRLVAVQGKYVGAGDMLCTLVDYGQLYIEGRAFEQDIQAINRAAAAAEKITATLGSKSTVDEETFSGLSILYLDEKVDRQTRALSFYVALPNRLLRESKTPDGRRFVYWQFKTGQRMRLRIPVERWKDRIVLPVEAVAQEGAEAYVFEQNGDHFDRRTVRVEYRDQDWVVIANDGALKIGVQVAASAAHQMQLALKSKSGGGVDPHAGHNH